jgi:hypothetical protein
MKKKKEKKRIREYLLFNMWDFENFLVDPSFSDKLKDSRSQMERWKGK